MERLNILVSTLNQINETSKSVVAKSIPIMKNLDVQGSSLVQEFVDLRPDIDETMASQHLKDKMLEVIRDAETVLKELPHFSNAILEGAGGEIERGQSNYPFLLQVWCGDMYDSDDIGGLNILLEELSKQADSINEEYIITSISETIPVTMETSVL